jgi:hypothetical protein
MAIFPFFLERDGVRWISPFLSFFAVVFVVFRRHLDDGFFKERWTMSELARNLDEAMEWWLSRPSANPIGDRFVDLVVLPALRAERASLSSSEELDSMDFVVERRELLRRRLEWVGGLSAEPFLDVLTKRAKLLTLFAPNGSPVARALLDSLGIDADSGGDGVALLSISDDASAADRLSALASALSPPSVPSTVASSAARRALAALDAELVAALPILASVAAEAGGIENPIARGLERSARAEREAALTCVSDLSVELFENSSLARESMLRGVDESVSWDAVIDGLASASPRGAVSKKEESAFSAVGAFVKERFSRLFGAESSPSRPKDPRSLAIEAMHRLAVRGAAPEMLRGLNRLVNEAVERLDVLRRARFLAEGGFEASGTTKVSASSFRGLFSKPSAVAMAAAETRARTADFLSLLDARDETWRDSDRLVMEDALRIGAERCGETADRFCCGVRAWIYAGAAERVPSAAFLRAFDVSALSLFRAERENDELVAPRQASLMPDGRISFDPERVCAAAFARVERAEADRSSASTDGLGSRSWKGIASKDDAR